MLSFLPVLVTGLLTGLSLIVAIGAQNAFVIRQSLTRKHVFITALICALSDALLIVLGIAGLGALIQGAQYQGVPWLLEVIRWFGVVYLSWFGIRSLRSAFRGQVMDASGEATSQDSSLKKVVITVLGLTFLNPHVYLDTVILLGSVGNTFGESKWAFAFGAVTASFIWFFAIGYGAKAAARFMAKPVFWKVLDILIAAVMFGIALLLAFYKF